ncbi:3082_t:CDS:2 [Scutellospora calospora]|uniref:3082_t:CDS:1 n=1 Tax=Scutellospora calospora TaxID=85575 RepID=A0ACA9K5K0_9GLOM|nr:3082_t:CDS:2 [Scutellospora calospora]
MFEQFKRFSSVLNFKDLLDNTGLPREGLQAVKSEWESIRSKSVEMLSPATVSTSSKFRAVPKIDIPATTELATRYECEWNIIRMEDEKNFRNAAIVDELIQRMLNTCENHYEVCESVKSESNQLPKVKEIIEEMAVTAGKLTELEKMIDELAKSNEELEFEEWKQQQRLLFNQHVDEKNKELEEKRVLYRQHYDEFLTNHQVQRVQLYQANFEAQMENYRNRAIDSSMFNEHPIQSITYQSDDDVIAKLDQVVIETADDRNALEDFLCSS